MGQMSSLSQAMRALSSLRPFMRFMDRCVCAFTRPGMSTGRASRVTGRAGAKREAQAAGLTVVDELAFGPDYAETLRRWRDTFLAAKAQVLQLGFDERFIRTWEFYLAYCEAAFDETSIDVVQYTLQKA